MQLYGDAYADVQYAVCELPNKPLSEFSIINFVLTSSSWYVLHVEWNEYIGFKLSLIKCNMSIQLMKRDCSNA